LLDRLENTHLGNMSPMESRQQGIFEIIIKPVFLGLGFIVEYPDAVIILIFLGLQGWQTPKTD
jgi:hypothetical protein